jgi:hypothetical protein
MRASSKRSSADTNHPGTHPVDGVRTKINSRTGKWISGNFFRGVLFEETVLQRSFHNLKTSVL